MNAFTDESRPSEGTQRDETAADDGTSPGGEQAPNDEAIPAAEGASTDPPPGLSLRIDKGHAEPEELAAVTVVLCAQLAALRLLAEQERPEQRPDDRRHPRGHRAGRAACWSGCWTCS
ncbi:acyl-CoA carboxylase epsilon subunit [Streptomyces sp. NPDC048506]|uniref:acyl-CoA carboxylase epsilon subunit n=1 Tax=Streptomyces sp. NPDC048506 TaxID=3155028 RepID=UPI003429DD2D